MHEYDRMSESQVICSLCLLENQICRWQPLASVAGEVSHEDFRLICVAAHTVRSITLLQAIEAPLKLTQTAALLEVSTVQ